MNAAGHSRGHRPRYRRVGSGSPGPLTEPHVNVSAHAAPGRALGKHGESRPGGTGAPVRRVAADVLSACRGFRQTSGPAWCHRAQDRPEVGLRRSGPPCRPVAEPGLGGVSRHEGEMPSVRHSPACSRAQIIRDRRLRAPTHELERAPVRGAPAGQRPGPCRLGVGAARRPEHRDEALRLAKRPGVAVVSHRHRVPRVLLSPAQCSEHVTTI